MTKRRIGRTLVLSSLCLLAVPMLAMAAPDLAAETGLATTGAKVGFVYSSPARIAGEIIRILFGVGGALFTALILYAGALWMTSRGDSERIKKAMSVLRNSVVGVMLMAFGYILVNAYLGYLAELNAERPCQYGTTGECIDWATSGTPDTATPPDGRSTDELMQGGTDEEFDRLINDLTR